MHLYLNSRNILYMNTYDKIKAIKMPIAFKTMMNTFDTEHMESITMLLLQSVLFYILIDLPMFSSWLCQSLHLKHISDAK